MEFRLRPLCVPCDPFYTARVLKRFWSLTGVAVKITWN